MLNTPAATPGCFAFQQHIQDRTRAPVDDPQQVH
jgi:hypothetical protein